MTPLERNIYKNIVEAHDEEIERNEKGLVSFTKNSYLAPKISTLLLAFSGIETSEVKENRNKILRIGKKFEEAYSKVINKSILKRMEECAKFIGAKDVDSSYWRKNSVPILIEDVYNKKRNLFGFKKRRSIDDLSAAFLWTWIFSNEKTRKYIAKKFVSEKKISKSLEDEIEKERKGILILSDGREIKVGIRYGEKDTDEIHEKILDFEKNSLTETCFRDNGLYLFGVNVLFTELLMRSAQKDKENIENYVKLAEIFTPEYPGIYYRAGRIYSEKGFDNTASEEYKKAIKHTRAPFKQEGQESEFALSCIEQEIISGLKAKKEVNKEKLEYLEQKYLTEGREKRARKMEYLLKHIEMPMKYSLHSKTFANLSR